MDSREAAKEWGPAPRSFVGTAPLLPLPTGLVRTLLWAGAASTLHRVRRGEGALLAINLSLIAWSGAALDQALALASVSLLAIALMYAFNDLFDAPTDSNNPKKDQALVSAYLRHRQAAGAAIVVATIATVALGHLLLEPRATLALGLVMFVNFVYSTALKGVPVVDVVWCGVWGAAYVAIVSASPVACTVVALMTAVCHLYQAMDDRDSDQENAITTTAVSSPGLTQNVLVGLSALLFLALWAPLGAAWASSSFVPLAIHLAWREPRTGWLLTKGYFGVLWLHLLQVGRALA